MGAAPFLRTLMVKGLLAALLLVVWAPFYAAAQADAGVMIIPRPLHVSRGAGTFTLASRTPIVLEGSPAELRSIGDQLRQGLQTFAGYPLPIVSLAKAPAGKAIILSLSGAPDSLGAEGYQLVVTPARVVVRAREPQGLFYGVQSLLQLLPPQKGKTGRPVILPAVTITDRPFFAWRGLHLDVGRHFFPVDFIKQTIDRMALHKLNTFHWHLTEDQGWRIEIKKYPKLTEVGAWREGTLVGHSWDKPARIDSQRYGGYYTQEQIREVVAYAHARQVTIVPEIDVPGHSLAALAAYPELSCTGGPFKVAPTWGVFDDVYCAGNEATFRFLADVFSEVADLFPGEVIHIGGDECPKTRWKACARCQARMKAEGLKDEHELQSYFIKRIQGVLAAKGKRVIGWDEILEGGLAPGAAVMSWRGVQGGVAAAKQQHDVVMTPNAPYYLDHYQGNPLDEPLAFRGYNTLRKVYDFNPLPVALTPAEARYIKGVQANLWTEYVATPQHAAYMLFPRLAALAETAWSAPANKDWSSFAHRLDALYRRYDVLGIPYARSAWQVQPLVSYDAEQQAMVVTLHNDADAAPIYYTVNGAVPGKGANRYSAPLEITAPVVLRAATIDQHGAQGGLLERRLVVNRAAGKKVKLPGGVDHRAMSEGAALVDGMKGALTPKDRAAWTGVYGRELTAVIDLDSATVLRRLSASFLQAPAANVALPDSVVYEVSVDGKTFQPAGVVGRRPASGVRSQEYPLVLTGQEARYVRVRTLGRPKGEQKRWIYSDEITIE